MAKIEARLLLDNIRSVHNVGSIFRTAETLGVKKIYCIGTTPVPVDRFGSKRKDFAKVSLGSEDLVAWEHVVDGNLVVKNCRQAGFQILALEQSTKSVDYKSVKTKGNILVILGSEVDGVNPDLLRITDIVAEIPMAGKKESLNVSVAAGVFLFRILDK